MKMLPSLCLCLTGVGVFVSPLAAEEPTALKDAFKDHFLVGTAVNRSIVTGQAGFRRDADLVAGDIALVKAQFNQIVAENDMKWMMLHPRAGADGYDFTASDALVAFGEANQMEIAGHTLVWHSQTPNWVFEGTHLPPGVDKAPEPEAEEPAPPGRGRFGRFRPFNLDGPRASREELLERMRDHIHAVVGRYKGKVKVWDVVNEAIADNGDEVLRKSPWSVIIGPDFINKAFEYAHEADPEAVLRYNDYGLENPDKRAKLLKLIKSLKEQGVPVMAIGSQAHLNVSMNFEKMDQCLTEIATLGLPIHITELDVNSAVRGQRGTGADIANNAAATEGGLVEEANKKLADAYEGIFKAFVKHRDSVKMVTFWGANDAVSWRRGGNPLLFDGNNQPKPAFDAVMRVASSASASTADENFHIYLCFGQSNMEGFPGIEEQDKEGVDERFQMLAAVDFPEMERSKGNWYPALPPLCRPRAGIGPADYFGRTLVSQLPTKIRVGVVNVSVAGSKIELFGSETREAYIATAPGWMKGIIEAYGGNPYAHLVEMGKRAQKDGVIKGILLHQGESNTNDKDWPAKVKAIYENLLHDLDLKAEDVPLLAGELVPEDQGGACASMNAIIRTLPEVIPTAYVVASESCESRGDHLHFTPAGYRELGKRYAETMLSLLKAQTDVAE
ncbi:MAG: endo-1,4-beta-xylanase [Verrucomicrobiales bacterium]